MTATTKALTRHAAAAGETGSVWHALLGFAAGLVASLWLRTLRLDVRENASLAGARDRRWVLCFHHGRQFPLLAWRRRGPTTVLVSLSRDGSLQARALAVLGFSVVRGSSSRGGARGLAALVARTKRGRFDAAFAVDGPRGPLGVVKEGALVAARATGAVLVPMGSAARRGRILDRAWDRFLIPWPLSRASVVLGAPIDPDGHDAAAQLERAIHEANAEAERCVA